MSTENWQKAWDIFEEALAIAPEGQRQWLVENCAGEPTIRETVEEMLRLDRQTDSLLEHPFPAMTFSESPFGDDRTSASLSKQSDIGPGSTIGPYRVLSKLGQGGMGAVYLAVRADDAFLHQVVIKLVRPGMESEQILERLRFERQILASLSHPYIARLYDGGSTEEGRPYFVLELVKGESIDQYCERNHLPLPELLKLFKKVCEAVHFAHQNLIVHRDIKPSNIVVDAQGDPKLLDFGIAKLLTPGGVQQDITAVWNRMLTPNYASPEQRDGKAITTASDVYSLGVLLHRLLTGRLPSPNPPGNDSESSDETPSTGPYEVGADLEAIMRKALRERPEHRYGSVQELATDLDRFERGLPVGAHAGGFRYRLGKVIRRHRASVAAAGAAVLVLIGFVIAMGVQSKRVAYERDQARQERDKKAQVLNLMLDLFRFSDPFVQPGEELTVRGAFEKIHPLFEQALIDQPDVRAELLTTSGSILRVLGATKESHRQLQQALELRRALHPGPHLAVAETMTQLAAAESELGHHDVAETLAREALELTRSLAPPGDIDLAPPLEVLVAILCTREEFEKAEEPAQELLKLLQEVPGERRREAFVLALLARSRNVDGNYREALRLNRENLAIRRSIYGEQHPMLISTLNSIGLSLRRLEEYDAAERTYQEAIDLQRLHFDQENPSLLNNLAGTYYATQRYASALELYRRAREVIEESRGPGHEGVYFYSLRIAKTRIRLGEAAEAESDLRHLLEKGRPLLEGSATLHEGLGILGESLSVQTKCDEAEPLLRNSFEALLAFPWDRTRREALERLEEHLERCGQSDQIPIYRDQLEAIST